MASSLATAASTCWGCLVSSEGGGEDRKGWSPQKIAAQKRQPINALSRFLTIEIVDDFTAKIRRGNFRYLAAQSIGFDHRQIYRWLKIGQNYDEDHPDSRPDREAFDQADHEYKCWHLYVETIKAEGLMHDQAMMDILMSDNAAIKMRFLERRFNRLYSNNPNAWVDDSDGSVTKIDGSTVLAERIAAMLSRSLDTAEGDE